MRFPFRSQLEGADCGPACIQMIAAYYGKQISISTLKDYCQVTRIGVSLKDILDGCKRIGIHAVPLHLSKEKVIRMPLPAILYWKQEHYVVLYCIKENRGRNIYYIADPGYGKIKLEESAFLEAWAPNGGQGVAVVVEPVETFRDEAVQQETIKQKVIAFLSTFRYLSKQKRNLLGVLMLSGIIFGCSLLIPFLLQKIMDDGIALKNLNLILLLLLGQMSLYAGSLFSSAVNRCLLYRTGLQVGLAISTQYIWKLVKLPISLFDTKLGADLLQRLEDEGKIRNFLTTTVSSSLFMFLNLLIYSCILLYYNIYVFLVFLLFSVISVVMARCLLRVRKRLSYALFTGIGKKKNLEYELVYGMMEIKVNAAQHPFLARWEGLQKSINSQSLKTMLYESIISFGASFAGTFRDVLITGGCAFFVIKGEMSIGIMLTITYILGQLSNSVSQIMNYSNTSQDAALAYSRLDNILSVTEENVGRTIVEIPLMSEAFRLNNVSFKYDGSFNPYVLKDVDIEIPRSKVTAIVGASGSGKSTLLKLLLAFYYPQKGELRIGGVLMKELDVNAWREKCGVVMQDGYIFSGTIADNIALSDEEPDQVRLKQAARIACIDEFIERLPMQYYTKIGKAGVDLSGGQKQRILIARAVYKNPEFIFFDEATSSLDATNEKEIMGNLKEFYKNKTVVIIAHRLSTVKDADNIIVLDNGFVVEQGSHTDLTARKGKYYHLVKNQLELGQ
ncbi:peptidase domain-containing ABC transporter [Bacteroides fragilis]|uniref:peptidase domain-containing ABC transporter n=1 Tax=Bacteroides fragilis TaxID=817 RepID=UPI000338EE58|nr:peptidase domain-containing ABC transporter [Bacteroides fragilis]MBW9279431.1 peptidase domain-containing ABC transporter [Bacteroides fragilis]CCZ38177.1 colicin V processing peptidase [Bacteroides fragilis CAG:558]